MTHWYLGEEQAIPRNLLANPRFAGRVLVDARSNARFPHADKGVARGYEIKDLVADVGREDPVTSRAALRGAKDWNGLSCSGRLAIRRIMTEDAGVRHRDLAS